MLQLFLETVAFVSFVVAAVEMRSSFASVWKRGFGELLNLLRRCWQRRRGNSCKIDHPKELLREELGNENPGNEHRHYRYCSIAVIHCHRHCRQCSYCLFASFLPQKKGNGEEFFCSRSGGPSVRAESRKGVKYQFDQSLLIRFFRFFRLFV